MKKAKVLLIGHDAISTRIVYHSLLSNHDVVAVLLEKRESRFIFLQRRIKKSGWWKAMGQLLFRVLAVNFLNLASKGRIASIIELHQFNTTPIEKSKIRNVNSVNDENTRSLIRHFLPEAIVVHGTRIIHSKTLEVLPGKFLNLHAGITPQYRGVHGMYWALAQDDPEHAGVTVHVVDNGIDTGKILYQEKNSAASNDNFCTYPYLQLAAGLPLLHRAIDDLQHGRFRNEPQKQKGRLWHHPTLWQYLRNRICRGAK